VTDDRYRAATDIGTRLGLGADEVLRSPHVLVGTVTQMCDDLRKRRDEFGVSYLGLSADYVEAFAPVVAALAGQ
jgi:hypothetical protein